MFEGKTNKDKLDVRRQIITKSFGNISFSEKEEP
jgi:hypothetical protein